MSVTLRDSLKDWLALQARLKAANSMLVKVGYIEGDGAEDGHGGISNVDLAQLYEYGSPGGKIVEHSFLRATWDATTAERNKLVVKLYGQVIDGKVAPDRALGFVGAWFKGQVQNFIASGQVQPATKGGQGTTLVDTGQLLNGITWQVEK